jgi:hypothetical protein
LRLVLDANEYIFSLGSQREAACERCLDWVARAKPGVAIRIPRLIVNEVRRNLTPEAFREFLKVVDLLTVIDEDSLIPFELGSKYEWKGFKPADAFIAAYTEWVGADILISENRHFLTRHTDLPFRVMTAHTFLRHLSP